MSIDKDKLFHRICSLITKKLYRAKFPFRLSFFLNLIAKVVYHDPTKDSLFKGKQEDYEGLPPTKSLFFAKPNCGLPIGNLTSQLFSNIYLHDLDQYIKETLQFAYYGRYVDDFVIVHHDKACLQSSIPKIASFLQSQLKLTLHPKKIYLQHYTKGVTFLGTVIKPYRRYLRKRTFGYFYTKIQQLNRDGCDLKTFRSVVNSYLGFMKHTKSYKQRKRMLETLVDPRFWSYYKCNEGYTKVERR
jgi:hypothetical protein